MSAKGEMDAHEAQQRVAARARLRAEAAARGNALPLATRARIAADLKAGQREAEQIVTCAHHFGCWRCAQ